MTGFLLNMRILYEQLKKRRISCRLFLMENTLCLKGIQLYSPKQTVSKEYVYLTDIETFPKDSFVSEGAFILFSKTGIKEEFSIRQKASCIIISEGFCISELFPFIQEIFAYYMSLERKVNQVLNHGGSIGDIVSIATEHFRASLFFHDEYYHIIARADYLKTAKDIQYDERKNAYIQDAKVINQFRTSPSYMATMQTTGGHLWESDYDDSKAIYANVLVNSSYKGRLILTNDKAPYTKAALYEIAYFADAVSILVKYRENTLSGNTQLMEKLILEAVSGREPEKRTVSSELSSMGWNLDDTYLCGAISLMGSELSKLSICSICADIEEKIKGSYTCYHKGFIYLIINLTQGGVTASDFRMSMAYLIRDGLMHMGVSNVFQDFYSFPVYLRQAKITLQYSEKNASTIWYNEFKSYALEYWLTEGYDKLSKKAVLPPELNILKEHDSKNGTKLFETLRVYLESERNSTLTSQVLKIHRSTLPYRLNHIYELTKLNLDDEKVRLYLRMGFFVMEGM